MEQRQFSETALRGSGDDCIASGEHRRYVILLENGRHAPEDKNAARGLFVTTLPSSLSKLRRACGLSNRYGPRQDRYEFRIQPI
ncbi:hypothetical protein J6590_086600 [Homalodisca vitripennis]|nr:hypothetical protein J6590_086600 [Homalodisca vitripennis]